MFSYFRDDESTEMAQVSPSQRLEIMQQESLKRMNGNNGQQQPNNNSNKVLSKSNDETDITVVPMGSYSMRFGGYGSLEEELYEMSEMRMAATFDSLDNSVDAKSSLLPGGRWVSTDDRGVAHATSSNGSSSSSSASTSGGSKSKSLQSSTQNNMVGPAEPLVRYDPVAAEKLLFSQPAKWLVRNVQIAFPFGVWVTGVLFDTLMGNEKSNRTKRAKELNSIIASLGPAIIKAGQALASRPDLLPKEYLDELQELQDNVPTFSNEIAFKIVDEELNQKFGSVFELVEPEPVAVSIHV